MDLQPRNLIPSGVEPVEVAMGGLESGGLYFVHGDASAQSLFGISFLIEGLKRGEQGAFVMRCPAEDAVRRFTQVGYDCLEDVYTGRLVIIEYSGQLISQTEGPAQLAPALRELEWLLGASHPSRIVVDPVTSVVAADRPGIEARVDEFARWTRQLGATAVLLAGEDNSQVTSLFQQHAAESFYLDMQDAADNKAAMFLAFEKSLSLPAQPIQVDPSRGILLRHLEHPPLSPTSFSTHGSDLRLVDIDLPAPEQARDRVGGEPEKGAPNSHVNYTVSRIDETAPLELDLESIDDAVARLVDRREQNGAASSQATALPDQPATEPHINPHEAGEIDLTAELFGDLAGVLIPGDLSGGESSSPETSEDRETKGERSEELQGPSKRPESSRRSIDDATVADAARPRHARRIRASDLKIDAAIAADAVDALLGRSLTTTAQVENAAYTQPTQNAVDSKSFKVLVIKDEGQPCEIIVQSLMDFTIEQTNDGLSGLAGLISYQPDLVVLDSDLPIVDGFKVLAHIRASLNVPVIIVSSSLAQQGDRVRKTERAGESASETDQLSKALAASGYYHLNRTFSTKELRDKARQLIARYRGIDAWIINPPGRVSDRKPSSIASEIYIPGQSQYARTQDQPQHLIPQVDWLTPYGDFVAELEKRVKGVIDSGSALSVVGCRIPQKPSEHGDAGLPEIIRKVVRDTDLAAANAPGEVVILLADARASGARAFANRLREIVAKSMNQEPSVWMRSFPELEETHEAAAARAKPANGNVHRRRASDRQARG